jgi:RNA polymerase sigma-70 factor (ECF subfamily)
MTYDDRSLAGQLLAGEPVAVTQVARWIAQALAAPKYWSLRREWEDLHQEALLLTLESLRRERFDATRDLRTYVQGIAHHAAMKRLAKMARERGSPGDVEPAFDPVPGLEGQIAFAQIARAVLDRLSPACRELIRDYFIGEMSYDEIASRVGTPVGTVKSRLSRCLATARSILRGEEPGGADGEYTNEEVRRRWRSTTISGRSSRRT